MNDGESLPSLEARLKPLCRERYRRIDRFIELALLGSGECIGDRALDPACGLYIASGVGPVGSNIQVQEELSVTRQLPAPFRFVNTLGSAVGHYVAKNLGLRGQVLVISRRGAAFEAALDIALADLDLGIVPEALVGAVEECTVPLSAHRVRLELEPDALVAEGSHWMRLGPGGSTGFSRKLRVFRFSDRARIEEQIVMAADSEAVWILPRSLDSTLRDKWKQTLGATRLLDADSAFHDSVDASTLMSWLAKPTARRAMFVSGCDRGGWTLLEFGA